jgi:hypothetical protein
MSCFPKSGAIPLLSLRAFEACKKGETYLDTYRMVQNSVRTSSSIFFIDIILPAALWPWD